MLPPFTLALSISTIPLPASDPAPHLLPLITQLRLALRPTCPSCRNMQPTHSVINQWGSQLRLGWSGQTSRSLCQQGILEITRHTTLIDARGVYTPHFRKPEMAGINSLLDTVVVVGRGVE